MSETLISLPIVLSSDAMSALDDMGTELLREAWERLVLLAANPVHPHPSLQAHRMKRLANVDDKWDPSHLEDR